MSADTDLVNHTANTHVHVLEVLEVIVETPSAISIVLDVPDRLVSRFKYLPGQFLTVAIPRGEGVVARCYSLSSSPHIDDQLIITVKRIDGGYASNWLCDNVIPGERLTVLSPSGKFVPRSLHQDILLLGAGSGSTPLVSIAKSALIGGTGAVYFYYVNRTTAETIFAAELEDMTVEFPDRFTVEYQYDDRDGIPSADALAARLVPYRKFDAYLCGPAGFMEVARAAMRSAGMDARHLHTEIYQSLTGDPFADIVIPEFEAGADAATVTVEIAGDKHELTWPREARLLDVLLSKGIDAPYSCREGACSACACTVRSGEVRMRTNDTLVDTDLAAGLTLACQAVPVSDTVDIIFDQ